MADEQKMQKKKQRDVAIFYGPSIRSRFVSLQMQNVKMTREQFKISGHSNRVHMRRVCLAKMAVVKKYVENYSDFFYRSSVEKLNK